MRLVPLRVVVAAFQIVLLLSMQLAEGTGVHHCQEHDAGVGAGTASMAAHRGHHSGHEQTHQSCHCIGVCCQASLVYPPVEPLAVRIVGAPTAHPESTPVSSLRDTVRLLPFAIGPPAIA